MLKYDFNNLFSLLFQHLFWFMLQQPQKINKYKKKKLDQKATEIQLESTLKAWQTGL